MKNPRAPLAVGLAAPLALMLASDPAQAAPTDPDMVFECWMAMNYAHKKGERVSISPVLPRSQFDILTKKDPAAFKKAQKALDKVWTDVRKAEGSAMLDRYIFGVAQDCVGLYGGSTQARQAVAATNEGELNSLGTLSAGALTAYVQRTGDAPAVADYLVYHYPYGKDLFKPNEDGDFLSELIIQAGKDGLRRWSDEAVYAIANKTYWQSNPPATRLIFAEYQRRMRQMQMNEAQAQQWAQRAADDRAAQARSANAKPVGSLGNGNRSATPGSGIFVCTTYSGTGGGRVCKEEK